MAKRVSMTKAKTAGTKVPKRVIAKSLAKSLAKTGSAKTKPPAPAKRKKAESDAFDIEAETLPQRIIDAAFRSGGYPYDKRMKRKHYDKEMEPLQIELQKLLAWVRESGERIVIVLEGRDGAGKGGAITRFTQHLNPRQARVVALSKPSDTEKGQWYFQRYATEMPAAGEIVFFDRSWYNRAGVERVMGFCTPDQTDAFLREAPVFEGMLARDGIRLIKLFLTIGREMQMLRLHARWHDPLKRWKLSPIDFEAIPRFDAYSEAFDEILERSSTSWAPWSVLRGNDKFRTRLNAIRLVLQAVPYKDKNEAAIGELDHKITLSAARYLDNGGEK
jgi:polyphosphate kinase 2